MYFARKQFILYLLGISNAVMMCPYEFPLVSRTHDFQLEIYINRLGTTTQVFMVMDYLILMSEKFLPFRKGQKPVVRKLFFTLLLRMYMYMYIYIFIYIVEGWAEAENELGI